VSRRNVSVRYCWTPGRRPVASASVSNRAQAFPSCHERAKRERLNAWDGSHPHGSCFAWRTSHGAGTPDARRPRSKRSTANDDLPQTRRLLAIARPRPILRTKGDGYPPRQRPGPSTTGLAGAPAFGALLSNGQTMVYGGPKGGCSSERRSKGWSEGHTADNCPSARTRIAAAAYDASGGAIAGRRPEPPVRRHCDAIRPDDRRSGKRAA